MKVTVRYFAAARELAGCDSETIEVDGGDPHTDALVALLGQRHPRLSGYIHRMRLAINGDFAQRGAELADGDEVVVLPPVAGGAPLAAVRDAPLSIDECVRAVMHPGAGGVCIFTGVVRDHADGKPVARLDYEAYGELAEKEMARIVADVERELAGVRIAVTHRVGQLAVGDLAIVVAASAPHRADAFAASRATVDRIKDTVPIWKKEWAPDGSASWVNLESD